jgi:hypothetical protein
MMTSLFEKTVDQAALSTESFEKLMAFYVQESARYAYATRSETTYSWQLPGESNIERRLLVRYDADEAVVTISYEIFYGLFEGDIRFYVKRAGTVTPQQFGKPLSAIVTATLRELVAWKPAYETF